MNTPKLADYGILDKYARHETDRSTLVIPVQANFTGGYTLKLSKRELSQLDYLIQTVAAQLLSIGPKGAVYSVPMPERLPDMFETFQADPEPVTIHFIVNTMFVTLQRGYNLHQCYCLLNMVRHAVKGIESINIAQLSATAENVTVFTVTFKASCAFEPDTASYKRIKALCSSWCLRITPRRAAPASTTVRLNTAEGEIVVKQESLF